MSPFGYCLNASTIRGTPILRQIEVAALAGYGAIELWYADLDAHLAAGRTMAEVVRALDEHGLAVPTMIYLGGWFDATDAAWPSMRTEIGQRLAQAAELGAPRVIAGPPGGRADGAFGARRYRDLLELGDEFGAYPAMEFLGFVEQYHTVESALEVVKNAEHPAGTVVVDPFHIFRGGGSMESLRKLRGEQVAVAHFNDAPAHPLREKQHDADRVWPGDGRLDLQTYLVALRAIGYTGWLSLELFRPELWERDPLEVAREGLEKMRATVEG
jgi:2-keto-myo-inositol isomerase